MTAQIGQSIWPEKVVASDWYVVKCRQTGQTLAEIDLEYQEKVRKHLNPHNFNPSLDYGQFFVKEILEMINDEYDQYDEV